ncbi:LOG family protein [Rhodobacteraceae bacterium NNCM2]|nr:LOG family protein [Coraliihabitans acroporae]
MTDRRHSIFRSAEEDISRADEFPETEQTRAPSYRLAFTDQTFLRSDAMRPVRLQLELQKPETILNEAGITSTVVFFGGARIPSPDRRDKARTPYLAELSEYYDEARQLARMIGEECLRRDGKELVVVSGGGPGVMEAANRGADDVGAPSIGLGIVLPFESTPNSYVTPDLCFNFHYFAIRKMHFLMRAKAITVFPGGFGTLDELFEALTLIQTDRMEPVPVILFGSEFWKKIINWEALRDAGTIGANDLDLFHFVDSAEEGWAALKEAGLA